MFARLMILAAFAASSCTATTYGFTFYYSEVSAPGFGSSGAGLSFGGNGTFSYNDNPAVVQKSDLTAFAINGSGIAYSNGHSGTLGAYFSLDSLQTFSFDPSNPGSISLLAYSEFPIGVVNGQNVYDPTQYVTLNGLGPTALFFSTDGGLQPAITSFGLVPEPSTGLLMVAAVFGSAFFAFRSRR